MNFGADPNHGADSQIIFQLINIVECLGTEALCNTATFLPVILKVRCDIIMQMSVKVLSHPGHGIRSKVCRRQLDLIEFVKTFRLSSKKLLPTHNL